MSDSVAAAVTALRPPNLILRNGHVITMDGARPYAQAVAMDAASGLILAVGDNADVAPWLQPGTRVVDCQGRTVVPGFIDAHCHILAYAAYLRSVDCSADAVRSIADIQAAIRQRAATTAAGQWLRAVGYDETDLAERRHPTRWDLDAAAPHHPTRLIHRTGHAYVLNTLALLLVGIRATTEEPPGGYMERDLTSGEPTGLLLEMNELIERAILPPPFDELAPAVEMVSRDLLSHGVTCVQDASATNGPAEMALLQRLHRGGRLRPRLLMLASHDALAWLTTAGQQADVTGVKVMLKELGDEVYPPVEILTELIRRCHEAGLQVAVHAVSEAAINVAVTAFGKALPEASVGRPQTSHRIEHASQCPPELAQRIGQLGLTVVTQPAFLYHNGDRYLRRVAPEQLGTLYPLRSLLAAGVPLAAGSDAPVAPADPITGLYGAVARRSRTGRVVSSDESISPMEALAMHTVGAARAVRRGGTLGVIAPGRPADLVVLSANPTAVPPVELRQVRVDMTVMNSEVVWPPG